MGLLRGQVENAAGAGLADANRPKSLIIKLAAHGVAIGGGEEGHPGIAAMEGLAGSEG